MVTMARSGNKGPDSAIRVVLGPARLDWVGSSAQEDVRRILYAYGRLSPGALGKVIGDEQMSFDDEDFFVADPTYEGGTG
jgi:hypothetical protein